MTQTWYAEGVEVSIITIIYLIKNADSQTRFPATTAKVFMRTLQKQRRYHQGSSSSTYSSRQIGHHPHHHAHMHHHIHCPRPVRGPPVTAGSHFHCLIPNSRPRDPNAYPYRRGSATGRQSRVGKTPFCLCAADTHMPSLLGPHRQAN